MRYVGQNFELAIPVPQSKSPPAANWLKRAFLDAHQRKYGHHDPGAAVEVINVRLTARKAHARSGHQPRLSRRTGLWPASGTTSPVWFAVDRPTDTRFLERGALAPGDSLKGPLIITQFDATTLVPPGSRLCVDASGSLLIEVDP